MVYAGTVYTSAAARSRHRTRRRQARGQSASCCPRRRRNPGHGSRARRPARLTGAAGRFELPPDHAEGDRRAALARWLTDTRKPAHLAVDRQPRLALSFRPGPGRHAERFWPHGPAPIHPELLDWLAVEFRDGGQSLKKLHRLLVTSGDLPAVVGHVGRRCGQIDADNVWYSHMNRRRLEAEAIRDSILDVSGKLNPAMGGPSFKDFVVEHPEHSPHYEYESVRSRGSGLRTAARSTASSSARSSSR